MNRACDLLPQANGLRGVPPQCGGEGEIVGPRWKDGGCVPHTKDEGGDKWVGIMVGGWEGRALGVVWVLFRVVVVYIALMRGGVGIEMLFVEVITKDESIYKNAIT